MSGHETKGKIEPGGAPFEGKEQHGWAPDTGKEGSPEEHEASRKSFEGEGRSQAGAQGGQQTR
jgi:hypothetical protein